MTLLEMSVLYAESAAAIRARVALLRAQAPQVQVVAGGAVLTEEYAGRIGAHRYAKDAMATVRFAEEVYGG